MRIYVTQADIDNGVATDCARCPIVLAAKRLFPAHEVNVGEMLTIFRHRTSWEPHPRNYYEPLPLAARRFVKHFDHGWFVEPFHFDMPTFKEAA